MVFCQMYGNIPPEPLYDLESILNFIPTAAKKIGENPVPIMLTLQPIPKELIETKPIYALEDDIVDDTLQAFSKLDDIGARFIAINDSALASKALIPSLAKSIDDARKDFDSRKSKFQRQLLIFLQNYYKGIEPNPREFVKDVLNLVQDQLDPAKDKSLIRLEQASHDFEDMAHVAKLAGFKVITSLAELHTLVTDLNPGDTIALFLVPPLLYPVNIDALSYIAVLLRVGRIIFKESGLEQYLCYVEDEDGRSKLQRALKEDDILKTFSRAMALRVTRREITVDLDHKHFDDLDVAVPPANHVYEPSLEVTNKFSKV